MTTPTLPIINSHNSWSRLEEVWLGDVYPASWYSHLEPQVRDVFQQLTEITQHDLLKIEETLNKFNVKVRRPVYNKIDDFLDYKEMLTRPQICPRDHFVVIGNTLIGHPDQVVAWQHLIDEYVSDPYSFFKFPAHICINGANVVRVGLDLLVDLEVHVHDTPDYNFQSEWPDYRVTQVYNGGHMDGCFAILKPGLILANHYYEDYDRTFPGWKIIYLDNPTYHAAPSTGYQQPYPAYNGKFWNTTVGTNRMFNDHVVQHALDWVGDYRETYFELNCLVIDESNVVMLAENHQLAEQLSHHNITVHWVPFRTRSFWDGAMHCLTVDIRRQSKIEDFFPERDNAC
jgi:hypothetical protein